VCSTCQTWALETYGRCAGCGVERMTPGIAADGGRLCTDCAGIPGSYFCVRCGSEGRRQRGGVCAGCILTDRLRELLDDGTGRVRPELVALFDGLRGVERPRSVLTWTSSAHVQQMLRMLARGEVELSHDGISSLSPWRSAVYLRDLLVHHGVLPAVDRHLFLFQRWRADWLATINDVEHRRLLERFASWHVERKLRAAATRGPIGASRDKQARRGLVQAAAFLTWLAARGRILTRCAQSDLDAWHAEEFLARRPAQAFLRWCMASGQMPRLTIPTRSTSNPAPISQRRRLALLRRAVTGTDLPLPDRVAATLILLYAQPVSRICRLTVDDVLHDGDQVALRLGDPPSPVPEPFAALLLEYIAARPNLTTATNPNSRWLFPGRRAGQPISPDTVKLRLRQSGIPVMHGRTAAIRQLVLQAPAPVVAGMLGYQADTTTRIAAAVGSPWARYAAGEH